MISRRTFVQTTFGAILPISRLDIPHSNVSTPVVDEPWNAGASAQRNLPADLTAEPGTVQVVQTSPVLVPEFATILIHNATGEAVMLDSVLGTVASADDPAVEREQFAYFIPNVIVPANEYWIGQVLVDKKIEVGTRLNASWTVNLHDGTTNFLDPMVLITTVPPEESSPATPVASGPDQPWPFMYKDESYPYGGGYVTFTQVFFDDSGDICGFTFFNDQYDRSGIAHKPRFSHSSGVPMPFGVESDSWLAIWSREADWVVDAWLHR